MFIYYDVVKGKDPWILMIPLGWRANKEEAVEGSSTMYMRRIYRDDGSDSAVTIDVAKSELKACLSSALHEGAISRYWIDVDSTNE